MAQRSAGTAEHRQKRLTKRRERDRAGRSILIAAACIYTNLRFSLFSLQTCGILCVAVTLLVHATLIHGNSLSLPYTLDRAYLQLPVTPLSCSQCHLLQEALLTSAAPTVMPTTSLSMLDVGTSFRYSC